MECADHHFGAAVDGYSRAIELNPLQAVYWANRAAAHLRLENFGSALSDATKAVELNPRYIKARAPAPALVAFCSQCHACSLSGCLPACLCCMQDSSDTQQTGNLVQ